MSQLRPNYNDLPSELLLIILESLSDAITLKKIILASSKAKALFERHASSILRRIAHPVWHSMGIFDIQKTPLDPTTATLVLDNAVRMTREVQAVAGWFADANNSPRIAHHGVSAIEGAFWTMQRHASVMDSASTKELSVSDQILRSEAVLDDLEHPEATILLEVAFEMQMMVRRLLRHRLHPSEASLLGRLTRNKISFLRIDAIMSRLSALHAMCPPPILQSDSELWNDSQEGRLLPVDEAAIKAFHRNFRPGIAPMSARLTLEKWEVYIGQEYLEKWRPLLGLETGDTRRVASMVGAVKRPRLPELHTELEAELCELALENWEREHELERKLGQKWEKLVM